MNSIGISVQIIVNKAGSFLDTSRDASAKTEVQVVFDTLDFRFESQIQSRLNIVKSLSYL